jgi:RimJ/RimL family protein N-acetyltransferase
MPQPGEIIAHFTTKTGKNAEIRYPLMSDAQALTEFINAHSLEDKFTRFSGEQMTLEEEQAYLESELSAIAAGDTVKLFCFVDGELAGVTDIHRDISLLKRKRHTGVFGIIVAKKFRGQGVGKQLMQHITTEAEKHIKGLRMIKLTCFANNTTALSLYSKQGFSEVGRVPKELFYKGEYVDDVIMVKETSQSEK